MKPHFVMGISKYYLMHFIYHPPNLFRLPCVRRRVKKSGANQGREFWTCILPDGPAGDPNGRCNTFQWGGAGTIGVPRWAMSNKSLENK